MKRVFFPKKPVLSDLGIITAVFLLASLVLYGYYAFFTEGGMETVFRNWDGPGYVVIAKSFYAADVIEKVNTLRIMNTTDFAYMFPFYAVIIRAFSRIGYYESAIFTSQLFSLLFIFTLYYLIKTVTPKANALVISLLAVFYTPRWFIVSHVGSSEPVLLFFLTLFLLFFVRKKFIFAAVCLSLAQITKSQAIVFFIGLSVFFAFQICFTRKKTVLESLKEYLPFLLVPASLIGVFLLLQIRYGNFSIYMTTNEQNHLLVWPPLKILTVPVGHLEGWKESLVYAFVLYLIPILILLARKMHLFVVLALGYYLLIACIAHSDISRYMIVLLPFLFLGYSDALSKKPVYAGLFFCIPMVYLYAVSYINMNVTPAL